jgi:hypothetical protein
MYAFRRMDVFFFYCSWSLEITLLKSSLHQKSRHLLCATWFYLSVIVHIFVPDEGLLVKTSPVLSLSFYVKLRTLIFFSPVARKTSSRSLVQQVHLSTNRCVSRIHKTNSCAWVVTREASFYHWLSVKFKWYCPFNSACCRKRLSCRGFYQA